jgi:hypothetical protein
LAPSHVVAESAAVCVLRSSSLKPVPALQIDW